MKKKADILILNAAETVLFEDNRVLRMPDIGIAIGDGKILDVAHKKKIKDTWEGREIIDASGKSIIPGLIDPHTHLVFAGCRHREFELRLKGKTYVEILKEGGGIMETVRATRAASEEELFKAGLKRLNEMLKMGVTTVEIKTGYGLDFENEMKLLRVIERLKACAIQDIAVTFLGAHAIPEEFRDSREKYVKEVISWLPEAKKYAEFTDVFMDIGAFTEEETRKIFKEAKRLGFKLKLHADELANTGGAKLAAEFNAISADHLVYTDENGMQKLKDSGVIPVLLPGTTFFLGSENYANARKMLEIGLPVALASDYNPGTSTIMSPSLIMAIATFKMHMTPEEALIAFTKNAAMAIGLEKEVGSIEPGKKADLIILDSDSFVHLVYEFSNPPIWTVLKEGDIVFSKY